MNIDIAKNGRPEFGPNATFEGDISEADAIRAGSEQMLIGNSLILDNKSVFALCGDAANQRFIDRAIELKGREAARAFGLMLPFEAVLPYAEGIDIHLRENASNPETLQQLLGGLSFLRFQVDESKLLGDGFPDTVIGHHNGMATLQTWDPYGVTGADALVRSAMKLGVAFPVATSLNVTGHPEIVDPSEADLFRERYCNDISILRDSKNHSLQHELGIRVQGSFCILQIGPDGFTFVREGSIGNDIMERILLEYGGADVDENYRPCSYPESVLHLKQLPFEIQELYGIELANALRHYLGWTEW